MAPITAAGSGRRAAAHETVWCLEGLKGRAQQLSCWGSPARINLPPALVADHRMHPVHRLGNAFPEQQQPPGRKPQGVGVS